MTVQAEQNITDPQIVANNIHSAAIHLLRALKGRERIKGISHAQLSALSVLYFSGALTISQLAGAEGVKLPTMSRLVKDMRAARLLKRQQHRTDARSSVVSITAKGKRLFEGARNARLMSITTAIEKFSTADLKTLAKAASLLESTAKTVRLI